MDDIRIAILGDEVGIRNAKRSLKCPQLVGAIYVYDNNLICNGKSDFLEGWDIIIVSFDVPGYSDRLIPIIEDYLSGRNVLIFDYYKLRQANIPFMNVDLVMKNPYHESYDGLILGISHSEWGIIADRLKPGDFAKLSVAGQDIFYNYKTLEYCFENYRDKIARLNTVFIDMYDYSYFNYDASITKKIVNYLGCGGFNAAPHNFERNIDYPGCDYEDLLIQISDVLYGNLDNGAMDAWDMLFETDLGKLYEDRYFGKNDYRFRFDIVTDEQIDAFKIGRYTKERYQETIDENKKYFGMLLDKLIELNPEVKIYLIMMPRYEGVWDKEEAMLSYWKDFFYDTLSEFGQKYKFEFLDYSRDEIGRRRVYYQDEAHFNFLGAMKFTDMLNKKLKGQ
jgi:hypothetical protein